MIYMVNIINFLKIINSFKSTIKIFETVGLKIQRSEN